MELAALIVAGLALLYAFASRKKAVELQERLDDLRRESTVEGADSAELQASLDGLRKLVALMAAGKPVDPEMVKENRLFRNVRADELASRFEADPRPYVIDVRTPQEWQGGHIPGAVHIPVDELLNKKRLHEVARDGRPMFLVCAGGGRSSAASAFLSERGYLNVFNVEGGMGAWKGPVVRD